MTNAVEAQITAPNPDAISFRQYTTVQMIMGETVVASAAASFPIEAVEDSVPENVRRELVEIAIDHEKASLSMGRLNELIFGSTISLMGYGGTAWTTVEQFQDHIGPTRVALALGMIAGLFLSAAGTVQNIETLRSQTPETLQPQRRLAALRRIVGRRD